MCPIAEQLPWNPIVPAAMLVITACVVVWALMAARWRQGRPTLPYQPRRGVPWRALDLFVILAFYLFVQSGALELARTAFDAGPAPSLTAQQHEEPTSAHAVAQLMAENNIWVLLLCFLSAAVVAPVAEEFFFRVLLQGWLESREHRWRRLAMWRRRIPRGILPIVLTALLFAAMHFRLSAPPIDARLLLLGLTSNAVASVLALAFAVEWLRRRVGASAADFGWAPRRMLGDVGLGLAAFAALAAPIYALQSVLMWLLPKSIAPDPLPLFFFALALGILYYRTHRIMPLIVLHAALNGTSLLLPWLGS